MDEKLGRILRIAGHHDDALTILERAARGYLAAADAGGERRAVAEIGRVHRSHGTTAEGVRRVREILSRQEGPAPTSGLAALLVVLARLYFTLGEYEEEVQAAQSGVLNIAALNEGDASLTSSLPIAA